MIPTKYLSAITLIFLLATTTAEAQTTSLPLVQIEDLEYQGAFVIPSGNYGESLADYTRGTIAYNSTNHSLFITGHSGDGAIAEFS